MTRNPRTLLILAIGLVVFIVAILGGALGNAIGLGFLASPLAAIAIPAEPMHPDIPIITNTMVATWIAIVVLLIITLLVRSRLNPVPGRLQGLVELVLEFFLNLAENIAGRERARRFFPLVMTIFLFIVTANWIGILPGFGTIGWIEDTDHVAKHHKDAEGNVDKTHVYVNVFQGEGPVALMMPGSLPKDDSEKLSIADWEENPQEGKTAGILIPYFRGANTDINMTLSIAIIAMVMIHVWGFSALGLGHLGKFINFKEGPIGFFVGILEGISEIAKLVSFTFRLFGNIFAGEVLLAAMIFLIPLIGIIPFLGLELFVGMIQAFIFAMLTLVFATAATTAHGGEHH